MMILTLPLNAQTGNYGKEIMRKSRDASKLAGVEAIIRLRTVDARNRERIRKITMASRTEGNVEKRIIKFLEPPDVKGTGMLIFDYENKNDDMWMYLPALRKIRRIVSTEKSKSFMGSEFSNSDMAAPNLDDFTIRKTGEEEVGNTDCYKIEMTPVNENLAGEYGFSKKIVWIGKRDFVLRRAVCYDEEGEEQKTLTAGDITLLDPVHKKYMARQMTIVNKQNGRKSYLKMLQVKFNPDVNPDYFTTTYLRR